MAMDRAQAPGDAGGDYVRFWTVGDSGKGEYRCSDCAYGVTVHTTLPVCPMCSGRSWERAPWRPFSRARLQPEQPLDLVPDHDREADARGEHGRQHEPEP